ncbi:MAG TPA: helix-turn-helix domain-containing protein [Anaerovoracaceae bacterium]|nr:helix-turn-helix domain-containing protein [Anaerovoracaceae bacterium]
MAYHVFFVEDEYMVRENVKNSTIWHNDKFHLAGESGNGEDAWEFIDKSGNEIDIVVTDIQMPFMDGLELCERIFNKYKHIKVVIISGYSEFEYAKKAMSMGVTEYLVKPLSAADLLETLERVACEIDVSKMQNARLQLLQSDSQHYLNTQRQKFLSDLSHGLMVNEDIFLSSPNYGIDLCADSYQCVVIEFHSESDVNYISLLNLNEHLSLLLKKYENILYFFSDSKTLNMIIKNGTNIFCQQICNEIIKSAIISNSEFFCICSIGSVQKEVSDLPQSLSEAQFVISLKANSFDHSISCIDDVNEALLNQNFIINSERNSLISILKFGTMEELNSYLERLSNKLEAQKLNNINFVYSGIQIISLAKEFVEEIGGNFSDVVKNDHLFGFSSFLGSDAVDLFIKTVRIIFIDVFDFREQQKNNKYGNIIAVAKEYIENNCHSPNLSLTDVANHVNISPAYFSQLFHQETGESFIDFLTNARMKRARNLLNNTAMRSSEIALACGYNDPNYFSKVFRKLFGVSPREYKIRSH